jgi:hypothetical protein
MHVPATLLTQRCARRKIASQCVRLATAWRYCNTLAYDGVVSRAFACLIAVSNTPVQILDLTNAVEATGAYHACALTTDGGVWCWGSNFLGQLGDGTLTDGMRPRRVIDLEPAVSIAATSYSTCAATTSGMRCWGSNTSGELGDGQPPRNALPQQTLLYCP